MSDAKVARQQSQDKENEEARYTVGPVLSLVGEDSSDGAYLKNYVKSCESRMVCPEGNPGCKTHSEEHQRYHIRDLCSRIWEHVLTRRQPSTRWNRLRDLVSEYRENSGKWMESSGMTKEDLESLGAPSCAVPYCKVHLLLMAIGKASKDGSIHWPPSWMKN